MVRWLGGSVVRWFLAVIVRYPVQSRTTKAKKQGVFRWFGGGSVVVRWFGGGSVVWWWLGGSVVAWWFGGGLVVRPHCFFRWLGGSVVRWFGGSVVQSRTTKAKKQGVFRWCYAIGIKASTTSTTSTRARQFCDS